MQKYHNILALTAVVSLAASLTVQAQPIASEGFNYNPGSSIIGQASGSPGWMTMNTSAGGNGINGGNWTSKSDVGAGFTGTGANPGSSIVSGSLSYTDGSGNVLSTSGGSLVAESIANSTTAQPEIGTTATFGALGAANTAASGTLWVSYLWQGLNTTGSSSGLYRQGTVMFVNGAASGTASGGSERLDIGMPNIDSLNQGTVNPNISLWTAGGIAGGNGSLASTAPLQSTVAANNGQADFILMEFVLDNTTTTADTVNVWINPTLGGVLGSPNLTWGSQDMSAINGIRISAQGLNTTYGSVGGEEQVDEINIGDTVASVEPVPEPASMALAGLGGLALLALKRQVRK